MEDNRNLLSSKKPFSYKLIGSEKAMIFYDGKLIFTAVTNNFQKLQRAINSDDEYQIQLVLAKMTGNFKHGNERK